LNKIAIGISSCLLGEEVRYNGGHKLSRLCVNTLSNYFDYKPLCPEVGIGLGIPRKPIHLIGDASKPRAVNVDDESIDVTEKLSHFAEQALPELTKLCGYIFIKGSPSCGLFKVKVYQKGNPSPEYSGRGIFAQAVTSAMPLLPVEEAGRLTDPVLRENFIARVYAYHRWQNLQEKGLTSSGILDFHASYKYCLMAHAPQTYTKLGQLLADAGTYSAEKLGQLYIVELMQALSKKANRKSNTNVLMHLQGYLKKQLQAREKAKLVEVIEQYRKGIVPLVVPVTLLQHHFNNHPNDYISKQAFFDPYPQELSLRNAI
tara:strand:- start:159708 stop:160655 length:948 start_codon:yes stop_codon:yes gene_type:complete